MMGQGMMGSGMMGRMGQGMTGMRPGMKGETAAGMARMFGSRVAPVMNLSVEDVRDYLTGQLNQLNNKRLKIGDIKADTGTITADVVTIDNSLVQRLKVDRRSGAIDYQD